MADKTKPAAKRPASEAGASADLEKAVMKDPVVKAAIRHSGDDSSPGRAAQQQADQSETSLRTEGQRKINLVWEITQSIVALSVTGSTLYVAARLAIREQSETAAFLLLSNVFFLVLGTYFSRTNHSKIGGVGRDQEGR